MHVPHSAVPCDVRAGAPIGAAQPRSTAHPLLDGVRAWCAPGWAQALQRVRHSDGPGRVLFHGARLQDGPRRQAGTAGCTAATVPAVPLLVAVRMVAGAAKLSPGPVAAPPCSDMHLLRVCLRVGFDLDMAAMLARHLEQARPGAAQDAAEGGRGEGDRCTTRRRTAGSQATRCCRGQTWKRKEPPLHWCPFRSSPSWRSTALPLCPRPARSTK